MNEDADITKVGLTLLLSQQAAERLHTCIKAVDPGTRRLTIISEEAGSLLTLIGEEDSIRAEAEALVANELAQPQGRRDLKIVWS